MPTSHASNAKLQQALRWVSLLHPWTKRGFLQRRTFIEKGDSFETGFEGLAKFAPIPPGQLRKASARCSRCRKRMVAYKFTFDPKHFPGCTRCDQCGRTFCDDCAARIEIEGWNAAWSACPNCKVPLSRFLWGE